MSGTIAGPDTTASPDAPALGKALTALRQLRGKFDALEAARHEGVAVVGIGCRFPGGATSPDAFWRVLREGVDTISEVPADRWDLGRAPQSGDPEIPAGRRTPMRLGGFIDDIDRFDPAFFGISPREAARMDPQQRHFLETAWEALEDAGLTREALQGSDTGVFVGANATDYLQLQLTDPGAIDTYTVVGGTNCIVSNRLSYLLDLHGPSMTVDTACSSSLVAVHLGVQSLRNGECGAAVVGGVNLIMSPSLTTAHAKGLPLAPDGRCKTFDAAANGYARGEGVGVLVLKRLSDAEAAGDRIWAVIRGTAVNQDGLTNGLTAPNGRSQQAVIGQALRNARLAPEQVTLLEAHGTGTELGDPIEVEALAAVYGQPAAGGGSCALGSVKTNIGHLEAAAGVAGLIKIVLSVHHRAIAPHLHLRTLNPFIELDGTRLAIPDAPQPWDVPDENRHAAVSAFGAGGTNAHVVVGPAPVAPAPEAPRTGEAEDEPWLLPLYAASGPALRATARAWRDHLAGPAGAATPFADTVHTAATRRTRHEHRLAVVAATPAEAADRLTGWLDGQSPAGAVSGRAVGSVAPGVVFVFPGQGSQRAGMGRELLRSCPAFRDAVTECDDAMRPWTGGLSVIDEVLRDSDRPLERIDLIQPALFALAVGLAARCRAHGIEPDAVVGHSMGEVAAAYVAGALSLDDAARVICRRSALLRRISGRGAMLVVALPMDQARSLVKTRRDKVSVAVSNSPTSTVLSGDPAALAELAAELRASNVFSRPVKVDVASHSPQVDPLAHDLLAELDGIAPRPSRIPILSTVTGTVTDGSGYDAGYWLRNLREPVLFWDALRSLIASDHGVFVEMSAHPVLLSAVEQGFEHSGLDGLALPAMRRDEPEANGLPEILGALHANGLPAALGGVLPARGSSTPLPGYPWQHEKYWFRASANGYPMPPMTDGPAADGPMTGEPAATAGPAESRPQSAPLPAVAPGEVRQLVVDTVAAVLEMPPARVDPDAGFFQMGMDSLLAAQVRVRLEGALGRKLTAPVMFEHPSVEALAAHLRQLLAATAPTSAPATPAPPPAEPPGPTAGSVPAAGRAPAPADAEDDLTEDELLALLDEEIRTSSQTSGGLR